MIRFLLRLAAMVALAVAVIMAVLDATRSVAASRLVTTPLRTSWDAVSPGTLAAAESFVREKAMPALWERVVEPVIGQPGFAVFAVLALLLYIAGYRPARRADRLAAG